MNKENIVRHIYFHSDLDGAVSAAMLLRWGQDVEGVELHPVDYHLKAKWSVWRLPPYSAVVDFLFHPDAFIWVDHHGNPFVRAEWAAGFRNSERMRWDRGAPCCPIVLEKMLDLSVGLRAHFKDYIAWSILIDSGTYRSPQDATDLGNPYVLLSKLISAAPSEIQVLLAQSIAWQRVEDVLRASPRILQISTQVQLIDQEVRARIGSLIEFDGVIVLFDQGDYDWPYQRYHPYLLHPKAMFVVGVYRTGEGFTVSLGSNPWLERPPFHLGRICESFGGGGHAQVGGVATKTLSDARRIAQELRREVQACLGQ